MKRSFPKTISPFFPVSPISLPSQGEEEKTFLYPSQTLLFSSFYFRMGGRFNKKGKEKKKLKLASSSPFWYNSFLTCKYTTPRCTMSFPHRLIFFFPFAHGCSIITLLHPTNDGGHLHPSAVRASALMKKEWRG